VTDPYEYLAGYEKQLEQLQQQAAQAENAFREARAEARTPDGSVTVVVAGGQIESVRLSPKAMDLGHTALGPAILNTIRRAQADAARTMEESMRPLFGEAGQEFLHEQVQRMTSAADTEPDQPERPTRPRTVSNDDDDFSSGGPLLR
jgi:DNA-binding protein YbaB